MNANIRRQLAARKRRVERRIESQLPRRQGADDRPSGIKYELGDARMAWPTADWRDRLPVQLDLAQPSTGACIC